MGQPNPPGDVPLIEGLDASWNEFVTYIPEDKRAEFAPKFRERISSYEELKQWEDLHKSGITPEHAGTALNVFAAIENNPQQVYKTIGDHLGLTPKEAKEVVEQIQDADSDDPRIARLEQQLEVLAQIALAERQMTTQEQHIAQQEAELSKEIDQLKKKYGDEVNEREVLLRMLNDGMTAEQAHQEFSALASDIRSRRPAPRIMGTGGVVPSTAIDVRKLGDADVKSYVAQMMQHASQQGKNL